MVRVAPQPWITLFVGTDPQLILEIGRSADEVRDELAGNDHRSDVLLLAERAAVAWLAREYADHLQSKQRYDQDHWSTKPPSGP
jgi:hypothetical protein